MVSYAYYMLLNSNMDLHINILYSRFDKYSRMWMMNMTMDQIQCTEPFTGFHPSSSLEISASVSLDPCLVGYTCFSPRKQLNKAVSIMTEHSEADQLVRAMLCVSIVITDLYELGAFIGVTWVKLPE